MPGRQSASLTMAEAKTDDEFDFTEPCILGIDEAGRGPVLGPMVYAAAYCPKSQMQALHALGADDSKQLKKEERTTLRAKILGAGFVRTVETVLSAEMLSNMMLRRQKYNLNLISHDTALDLVQSALDAGANITEVYVDTVGPPEKYADKFRVRFPGLAKVDVRKKADSTFRIVGAASIVAKTTRDAALEGWEFEERDVGASRVFGSGYPGDPETKKWMVKNIDSVFGYPNCVRFSWGTAKKLLEEHAVDVEWYVPWYFRCAGCERLYVSN